MARRAAVASPAREPERQREQRPTTQLTAQELDALIRDHAPEVLETERQLVEPAPSTLAGGSSSRLAHTVRRGSHAGAPIAARATAAAVRSDIATIAMPRLQRGARSTHPTPPSLRPDSHSDTDVAYRVRTDAGALSSDVHPTHEPGLGATFEVELRVAPEPGPRVANATLPRFRKHLRLVLPITVIVALGAGAALLLRAIP